MKINQLLTNLMFIFCAINLQAQEAKNDALFLQLKQMDSIVFEQGFNLCNLDELQKTIHPEFEFYHDISGYNSKEKFMEAMKQNICSAPTHKPIRKLVPESLQVFPLYNQGKLYGAIQNGTHEFWIKEPEKELYQTGIARFSTTWLLVDGIWLMKNVLSYDHKAAH